MQLCSLIGKGCEKQVSNIASNVAAIRAAIAEAAQAAGRRPEGIRLVAVTKNRTVEEIQAALAAGITDIGENRVQEALGKYEAIGKAATWHLIGTLQTNKVKQALGFADLIHSLDRLSLARELAKQAERLGIRVPVLVQVNVAGEDTKHGIAPAELFGFLEQVVALGSLDVQGLMTIAPLADDPETVRPVFAALRELSEQVRSRELPGVEMRWLSMGMSGDYLAAIREGANIVRIGTAIFGPRPAKAID